MPTLQEIKDSHLTQAALWALAFVGVCVLVYVGKLKPETVELMVMALVGASSPFGGGRKDANEAGR